MAKVIRKYPDKRSGVKGGAEFLLSWNCNGGNDSKAMGGATGASPVGVWAEVWQRLADRPDERKKLVRRRIGFLDEYVGAFPSYHHWAWRTLHIGCEGFPAENVSVPRGCFFDKGRVVTSNRLDAILRETAGEWEPRTEKGEDGEPPEIRIKETATYPALREIRDSMAAYDDLVRSLPGRLQILGIGIEGHIGFVERGAAERNTGVMLVNLASSTRKANDGDFSLRNADGEDVSLEPAHYAITQGIGTVLSAETILMLAWGKKKQAAVGRMLLHDPGPQNPAAWIQAHENVTVVLDEDAFGGLSQAALRDRGWDVQENPCS